MPWPANNNRCAQALPPVKEMQGGAGSLQQGLRDENAQPHAAAAGPGGDIRVAQQTENICRETRAIITDRQLHLVFVPGKLQINLVLGELRGIFDQISQTLHQFGTAFDQGGIDIGLDGHHHGRVSIAIAGRHIRQ